jgi:hypothetical protein
MMGLCALTGPFIIFIAPIAAMLCLSEARSPWRRTLFLISGIGAMVQASTLLLMERREQIAESVWAASPGLLVQILAKQVFLAAIVGRRTLAGYSLESGWGWAVAVLAVCVGCAIECYALLKAPPFWKGLIFFSLCILGVSLAFPTTKSPQWPALLSAGGVRYWFFPMLAFIASVVWMLHERNSTVVRATAGALLLAMLFGIIQDWGHPRLVDFRFPYYVQKLSELPSGTSLFIPINPAGWTMELMKR